MKPTLIYRSLAMIAASLMAGSPIQASETKTDSGDQPSTINKDITSGNCEIDLDVDSDNEHAFKFDGFDLTEDKTELDPPGKIVIATSNGNSDKDDLWDFADGFNLTGVADLENTYYMSLQSTSSSKRKIDNPGDVAETLKFIPVQLTLVKGFDPAKAMVTITYDPVSVPAISDDGLKIVGSGSKADPFRILVRKGGMRIWRKEAHKRESGLPAPQGDFVASSVEIPFKALLPQGSTAKLYLEYLDPEPSQAQGLRNIAAKVTQEGKEATDAVVVTLCPANVVAHKHAKCGSAGAGVSQDFGNFGYETVVIENGDDDIEPDGNSADYEKNGAQANLDKDDDFVKLTFKLSPDAKIPGAKVRLAHEGMRISGQCGTMGKWGLSNGSVVLPEISVNSNLRFYTDEGKLLNDGDLVIADMKNPGNGYFAKLITKGEVSLWVEGDRLFGQTVTKAPKLNGAASDSDQLGGARVRLVVEQIVVENDAAKPKIVKNDAATVLIYRGGFFRFRQPAGQPGTIGTLEFRDGKGRINCIGKPWGSAESGWSLEKRAAVAGTEFTVDEWDMGEVIADYSWEVRSGKMKDGSQGEPRDGKPHKWGKDYWITEDDMEDATGIKQSGHGHTPPGWWYVGRRSDPSTGGYRDNDNHTVNGPAGYYLNGVTGYYQGYYVRWKKDDPVSNYATPFVYQSSIEPDKSTGFPNERCMFKADMYIVPGNYNFGRTYIQMHPDGWRNGSSGCVSLQWWKGTKKVDKFLRKFNGLKVRVQTN